MIKRLLSTFLPDGAEPASAQPRSPALSAVGKFSAVTIVATSGCCETGRLLLGQRILAANAPRLPLPDCSRPAECRCRFQKHADRREGELERRFVQSNWHTTAWDGQGDRRKKRGRRKSDE